VKRGVVWAALPLFSLLALALAACSTTPTGIGEPIFVYGAQFYPGPLPGSPEPDAGAGVNPQVTSIITPFIGFRPGEAGRSLTGDVTGDATSVAVRFADYGTGYWVFLPGPPDTNAPGDLTWSMTFDLGYSVPPGMTTLNFAALDATGASGSQYDLPICVGATIPDNYNACGVANKPPAAVLSLSWDTPVDLDLELETPSGVLVDPDHPTTSNGADGGVGPNDGVLDQSGDANCVPDHVNREDIVWQETPEPGTYLVYADLFSACGQSSVRFTATLYVAEPVDGGSTLTQKLQASGELLAIDANGGAGLGLYLTSFTLPFSPP
jgi:hypothetical protein